MADIKKDSQKTGAQTGSNNTSSGEKKISLTEVVLITPAIMLADFFELLSNLIIAIPVVGQVAAGLTTFIGLIVFGLVQFYLFMKGARSLWFLAGGILDEIPLVAGLPLKTATWIAVVLIENNPKIKKVASVASGNVGGATKVIAKK